MFSNKFTKKKNLLPIYNSSNCLLFKYEDTIEVSSN
jgi:hypothetical protein